jgi:hypothetical protein
MSTKTTDERLDEAHRRIDALQARAHAVGADANDSIKGQVDGLRLEEASARAAVRERNKAKRSEVSQHVDVAEHKLYQLQARLGAAEHALTAELAEDVTTFTDEMDASLDDLEEFFDLLDHSAAAKSGTARERAEGSIGELKSRRDTLLERLAEVRQASGERWHERKKHVDAARAELERKIDDTLKKIG